MGNELENLERFNGSGNLLKAILNTIYSLPTQRSSENPYEDTRQSETLPVYIVHQGLQYSGCSHLSHAEP